MIGPKHLRSGYTPPQPWTRKRTRKSLRYQARVHAYHALRNARAARPLLTIEMIARAARYAWRAINA